MNRNLPSMEKVFERGKLSRNFLDFLYKHLSPEYIPSDYRSGFYIDWKILGKYHNCFTFDSYFGIMNADPFRNDLRVMEMAETLSIGGRKRPYSAMSFNQWVEYTPIIRTWAYRATQRIFSPEMMLRDTFATDRVSLRILVSQINNWNLPKDFRDEVFDSLIDQYYTRKRVFDMYYFVEILEVPFY